MLKRLDFIQKGVQIEETLMKLNICLLIIKDDELLEKYNEIWGKKLKIVSTRNLIKKYLKAEIKCYNRKINANFHNNKVPEKGYQCICLSIILIDSVFRTCDNYYPEV